MTVLFSWYMFLTKTFQLRILFSSAKMRFKNIKTQETKGNICREKRNIPDGVIVRGESMYIKADWFFLLFLVLFFVLSCARDKRHQVNDALWPINVSNIVNLRAVDCYWISTYSGMSHEMSYLFSCPTTENRNRLKRCTTPNHRNANLHKTNLITWPSYLQNMVLYFGCNFYSLQTWWICTELISQRSSASVIHY